MATPKKLTPSTPVYVVFFDPSLIGKKGVGIYLSASVAYDIVDRYPGSRIFRTTWACIQALRKLNYF